tara:strand:+ start:898 stop:1332 length:435 start_codon:yes stop_codon:yes gene_type:complete
VDNLRYFKFVANVRQGNAYEYKVVQGNIYPSDFMVSSRRNVLDCSTDIWFYEAEWQEVYVSDVEPVPQKTFPPDAVTLDTYEGGKWYDVREVLPDERFDKVMFVELYSLENKQVVWDAKDQKFISLTGEVCDDVKEWRANILSK